MTYTSDFILLDNEGDLLDLGDDAVSSTEFFSSSLPLMLVD